MVHAIHVEVVTRQALTLLGMGSEMTVQDALDEFDTALHKEPAGSSMSPEMAELRKALGV